MLKAEDPDTPVSVGMIRRLLADGTIPCLRNGRKIFLNYDAKIKYVSTGSDAEGDPSVPDYSRCQTHTKFFIYWRKSFAISENPI